MPKKSARTGAQRNKPRMQKSIELVRQTVEEQERSAAMEAETGVEAASSDERTAASTAVALDTTSESIAQGAAARRKAAAQIAVPETPGDDAVNVSIPAPRGGAAARVAARRQAVQKTQQRPAPLITSEHYAYVRRELIVIGILALLMFSVIIILHFIPAIGG
jgi:CCR4-NOT transcriptional regulation complex NOT5 subunit